MDVNTVMEKRRSIRKYKEGTISKEEITEMIRAANLAPSWKNSQCPRYYVVYSEDMKEKLRTEVLLNHNPANCVNAVCYFVMTFEKGLAGFSRDGSQDNELGDAWGFYDLGLASENLLLKAADMGYGTLVMGIRDADACRKLLAIPENEVVTAVISVGIPDIDPAMPKRKTVDEITKWF